MSLAGDLAAYGRIALPLVPGASKLPWVAGGGGPMPELVRESDVRGEPERLAPYAHVCGFGLRDEVPATWVHVLAFPLHMALMADGRFPLAAVGLVHLADRIEQRRPIGAADELHLTARTGPLEPHAKGRTFALETTAAVDGEVRWVETMTLLRRGRPVDEGGGARTPAPAALPREPAATWELDGGLGRRYAAVSGDVNPIHMTGIAAKAFGFPRAIAHGMWTAARCLAALEGDVPEAFAFDVRFRAPILLPASVVLARRGRAFAVRDARTGTPHLDGSLEPIRSGP